MLVPATGYASDSAVFATALLAARPFAAHLEFLHVKVDVTDLIVAMTAGGVADGGIPPLIDRTEEESSLQEKKARQAFSNFCEASGIVTGGPVPRTGLSAEMQVETGSEAQWLAAYGRCADLVVVGRTRDGGEVAMDVLEATLMETGRPLLIAPEQSTASLMNTVLISWKDTPEAARAVAAALPFIERAGKVVIVSVEENEMARDDSADRLQRNLRWHNAETTVQHLRCNGRPPVDVMLEAAGASGDTLLVMGGYSHSRWREMVFGGFTQHILRGADLPVLMAH